MRQPACNRNKWKQQIKDSCIPYPILQNGYKDIEKEEKRSLNDILEKDI